MVIKNEKELSEALKNNRDELIIEGDLKNKVFKIKATGKVAWILSLGAISVAVTAIIVTTASTGASCIVTAPTVLVTGGVASTFLGVAVAESAVKIAFYSGGVNVLNELRDYIIVENTNTKLILHRKR